MDIKILANMETQKVNCPLCGKDNYKVITEEFGKTKIVKCKLDTLIYTNPIIKNPEKFYFNDEDYYFEEARLIFEGKAISHRWPNYLHDIKLLKKFKAGGKLLDVGSNLGFFAKLTKEAGYTVYCVEPPKSLAKLSKKYFNLNVFNGFLEDFQTNEKFDFITMTDVFEHITTPREILKKCGRLLKDDGLLFIKLPNAKFSLFKEKIMRQGNPNKDIWDSYEHVVHYTQKTIGKLLLSTGFKPLRFFIDPPVQLPDWHAYVGKYYQYPTPWHMDIKRKTIRKLLYILSNMLFCITKVVPHTAQSFALVARKVNKNKAPYR